MRARRHGWTRTPWRGPRPPRPMPARGAAARHVATLAVGGVAVCPAEDDHRRGSLRREIVLTPPRATRPCHRRHDGSSADRKPSRCARAPACRRSLRDVPERAGVPRRPPSERPRARAGENQRSLRDRFESRRGVDDDRSLPQDPHKRATGLGRRPRRRTPAQRDRTRGPPSRFAAAAGSPRLMRRLVGSCIAVSALLAGAAPAPGATVGNAAGIRVDFVAGVGEANRVTVTTSATGLSSATSAWRV